MRAEFCSPPRPGSTSRSSSTSRVSSRRRSSGTDMRRSPRCARWSSRSSPVSAIVFLSTPRTRSPWRSVTCTRGRPARELLSSRGLMSFQGSLRELQLPDIIQLVSASGKTGKFTLVRDEEQGTLFLKQGRIVHAQVGDVAGEEAVHVLASWSSGEFQFSPGEETEAVSISKSNARLLMEAAHQHDEWRVPARKG